MGGGVVGVGEGALQSLTVNIIVCIVSLLRAGNLKMLSRIFSLLRAENLSRIAGV